MWTFSSQSLPAESEANSAFLQRRKHEAKTKANVTAKPEQK
jgi:hypothetical protein